MSLNFKYETWDYKKDLLMEDVSNPFAIAVLRQNLDITHKATLDEERRDQTTKTAVDGIVHLLAASIEWLREYGITKEDVEGRVTKLLAKERESTRGQHRLTLGGTEVVGGLTEGTRTRRIDVHT